MCRPEQCLGCVLCSVRLLQHSDLTPKVMCSKMQRLYRDSSWPKKSLAEEMDEYLRSLILVPPLCGTNLSTEVCVKPSCCPCPTIPTQFCILEIHLWASQVWSRKGWLLCRPFCPSTPPKSPKPQGTVPGIPSIASYMKGGSLALGIRSPSFLKACTNVSEEMRKPWVLTGAGQEEQVEGGRWEERQLWREPGALWGHRWQFASPLGSIWFVTCSSPSTFEAGERKAFTLLFTVPELMVPPEEQRNFL